MEPINTDNIDVNSIRYLVEQHDKAEKKHTRGAGGTRFFTSFDGYVAGYNKAIEDSKRTQDIAKQYNLNKENK